MPLNIFKKYHIYVSDFCNLILDFGGNFFKYILITSVVSVDILLLSWGRFYKFVLNREIEQQVKETINILDTNKQQNSEFWQI